MRSKEEEWKADFVEEALAKCEVAARFLAERYSNSGEDIIDLVFSRERDCFTGPNGEEVSDDQLIEEIEQFMEANRLGLGVSSQSVLHLMRGLCYWWAPAIMEGVRTEELVAEIVRQFPEVEVVRDSSGKPVVLKGIGLKH